MQGKTFLVALFCVVRCILFPATKIVVVASTRSQGTEVLLKITDDFCKNYEWGSTNLNNEISKIQIGQNKSEITFKNGSWIRVAIPSDSSRGMRANILIVDEFRLVDLDVINNILRRFLTASRSPLFLNKKKYENYPIERNKEVYMSSAWMKMHYSYDKFQSYVANFLDDTKKYFVCDLPYQVSIQTGLLNKSQIEDEMSEADFDEIKFETEMLGLWYGNTDGAFFKFDEINKRRKLKYGIFPMQLYDSNKEKIPELKPNERRIMSVDVALLASTKHNNDASAIIINSAVQSSNNSLTSNIVYIESHEGLLTDELGIIVMRLFNKYKCTDLVLDTNGRLCRFQR